MSILTNWPQVQGFPGLGQWTWPPRAILPGLGVLLSAHSACTPDMHPLGTQAMALLGVLGQTASEGEKGDPAAWQWEVVRDENRWAEPHCSAGGQNWV